MAFEYGKMPLVEKREAMRRLREAKQAKLATLDGVRLYECPLTWLTTDTFRMIRALRLTGHGTGPLLWAGGWADQPHWLVEVSEAYKELTRRWQEKMSN